MSKRIFREKVEMKGASVAKMNNFFYGKFYDFFFFSQKATFSEKMAKKKIIVRHDHYLDEIISPKMFFYHKLDGNRLK